MIEKILKFIFCIGLCLGVGYLGSLITQPQITSFYQYLNKPSFAPPNSVFGPVWTILYILMGISFYLILISRSKLKELKPAILLFCIQLLLNFLWSLVFFGLGNIRLAMLDIILLWLAIIFTIKVFYPISKLAAYLLVPYILWVSFASMLNLMLVILN